MSRLTRVLWRAIAACALLVWASAGCGGGGGGPTAPPPPPPPPPSGVTFTADAQAGPNSVYLAAGQGSTATVFVLDVRVSEVTDLYAVAFVIEFPNNLLDWRRGGTVEGSLLSDNGDFETELVVENRPAGNLVIGHTRLGQVPGMEGSGTLFSLEFVTQASGTGALSLRDEAALDSLGQLQEEITWIGGSVNVRVQ